MSGGRPSDYTPEIAQAICMRIAEGESLRMICRDDSMPDKSTVLRWIGIGLCRVPDPGLGRKKCVRSFPSFAPVSISRSIWTRRSPASTRRAIPISS
ncbi:hypothetical protein [Pseudomonas aeruginosa]|uniref:terminase small subunit-like protein n=1 Tax=Pseudomonas aeruginosa TaxID=287 RepID=UPI003D663B8D